MLHLEQVIWNRRVTSCLEEFPIFVHRGPGRTKRSAITQLHQQPGIELHFTHSGRGAIHLNDSVLVQEGRHVVVLTGDSVHQVFADLTSHYQRTVVCLDFAKLVWMFGADFHDGLMQLLPNEQGYQLRLTCEMWQEVEILLDRLYLEYEQRDVGWQGALLGNLLQLLVLLRRSQQRPATQEASNDWVANCMKIIDSNLDQELTVEMLAGLLMISPKHLSRVFSRTTGLGISEYIRHNRVLMAQRLLTTNTTLSINTVALRCGFKTVAHFSRTFTSRTLMTPSEFRLSKLTQEAKHGV